MPHSLIECRRKTFTSVIKIKYPISSYFLPSIALHFNFSAYYHITKVIEASRVHLFDIVTQYRAIFSDDDPIFMMDDDQTINYSNILHAWISRKVSSSFSFNCHARSFSRYRYTDECQSKKLSIVIWRLLHSKFYLIPTIY